MELYQLKQMNQLSIREIAHPMGRSHSTISRELRRNQNPKVHPSRWFLRKPYNSLLNWSL
ncbi:MAG: helix-turn-helix domain-containing protein [Cyanobacteria bacterium RM1_2_2]|nr:helix-turn-helix domain-containing protein [Cyanobacteria bacterium RM1_2_2]